MTPTEYLALIAARDAAYEAAMNGDKKALEQYRQLQKQVEEARHDHLYYEAQAVKA